MGYRKAQPGCVFKAFKNRILVEPLDTAADTIGRIIVVEQAKPVPQEAEVLSVGSDVEGISEGDRVVYSKYSGHTITMDNREYVIIEDTDVLGLMMEEAISNGRR